MVLCLHWTPGMIVAAANAILTIGTMRIVVVVEQSTLWALNRLDMMLTMVEVVHVNEMEQSRFDVAFDSSLTADCQYLVFAKDHV